MQDKNRIIVALDYADEKSALAMARQLDPQKCRAKVGKELFTRCGPRIVEQLQSLGLDVFLDLKFHDIPNTVAKACRAAADMGVWMLNVHASGGRAMMEAARKAIDQVAGSGARPPKLIAVTILTSLSDQDIREAGYAQSVTDTARQLAVLAKQAGMDGVVCSAQEIALMRAVTGDDFCLVTPGIRPAGASRDDQQRIVTPGDAVRDGSDYLVIGRPITAVSDPLRALEEISAEVDMVLG